AFGTDAVLNVDGTDVQELGNLLRFLKAHAAAPMPGLANIGLIDDGSPVLGEVMNMLTRRNLLYRIVKAPERDLAVTVQLGSKDFPKESAADPNDFAARLRDKVGDDNRFV